MSDPLGRLRHVHTPLVSWIADNPEQLLIACTSSKNSPISLASAEQFRDATPTPPAIVITHSGPSKLLSTLVIHSTSPHSTRLV